MRVLFLLLGFSCIALGALGAILPILPTTPFILLAAGCFARSSTRCYQWLLSNRLFGPLLINWQTHRSVSVKIKTIAITSILVFGGYSLVVATNPYLQLFCAVMLAVGMIVVLKIRTVEPKK